MTYTYAGGDPVNHVDPSGLSPVSVETRERVTVATSRHVFGTQLLGVSPGGGMRAQTAVDDEPPVHQDGGSGAPEPSNTRIDEEIDVVGARPPRPPRQNTVPSPPRQPSFGPGPSGIPGGQAGGGGGGNRGGGTGAPQYTAAEMSFPLLGEPATDAAFAAAFVVTGLHMVDAGVKLALWSGLVPVSAYIAGTTIVIGLALMAIGATWAIVTGHDALAGEPTVLRLPRRSRQRRQHVATPPRRRRMSQPQVRHCRVPA